MNKSYSRKNYTFDPARQAYVHTGFRDTSVTFEASDVNSELAAITSQYYDFFAEENIGSEVSLKPV